jgi:RNA polymerase sigma factor (sigma-70 family)
MAEEPHVEPARRYEALFRAYGRDIVAYCGWRSSSAEDAQDAVADVFLVAWRRLDEVPEGSAARPWLYSTARRVIANQRRASRRRLALRDRLVREPGERVVELFSSGSGDGLVREALRRLRPIDREVLLLAEWESLTPAEIAEVMGCMTVTARGRLHRARFRFRAEFEELQPHGHETSFEKGDDHGDIPRVPRAEARQPAI